MLTQSGALLQSYAGILPEALDALTPEERYRIYKLLHLRVIAHAGGIIEVSRTFADIQKLGVSELTWM